MAPFFNKTFSFQQVLYLIFIIIEFLELREDIIITIIQLRMFMHFYIFLDTIKGGKILYFYKYNSGTKYFTTGYYTYSILEIFALFLNIHKNPHFI